MMLALARTEGTEAGKLLEIYGISPDVLFTHPVECLQREGCAPVRGKKEAAATKLLEQFSEDLIQ